MSSLGHDAGTFWREEIVRREMDGAERVPLLARAHMVALAPPVEGSEPVYVYVEWTPGQIERPVPGSAVWRAVLDAYLAVDHPTQPQESLVRAAVRASRDRFPSLEHWFRWRDEERRTSRERPADPKQGLRWTSIRWPW
ncbi:MAG: hypothetical protein KGL93_03220 [Gemmatimonadota bacterium]|nr:hypothetical protein [Gemmatimonadota bacterium]